MLNNKVDCFIVDKKRYNTPNYNYTLSLSNIITINKTLQRILDLKADNKTKVIIESPKSKASERQIPIPALLHEQLESIKSQTDSPNYYVLTSSEKYIEPSNYYVKYQHWLNECGIENHSFHDLRHTFCNTCHRVRYGCYVVIRNIRTFRCESHISEICASLDGTKKYKYGEDECIYSQSISPSLLRQK